MLKRVNHFYHPHTLHGNNVKDAGPQLLLQAFLQRVLNGGGRLNREFDMGRRRTDLHLEWPVDEAVVFLARCSGWLLS